MILQGRRVGDRDALLLAIRFDPWRPPQYELHRVDLAAGQGRVLYTFPEGYTIDDIDWSPDPWRE